MNSSSAAAPIFSAADDAPSRVGLLFGAFGLFFLSFVMSGDGNSVPQLFFQRFYPDDKTLLLSVGLFASTIAATLAVVLSRRHQLSQRTLVAAMLASSAATLILYSTGNGAVFLFTLVTVHFAANYLTNQIDYAAVLRAGAQRRFNDAAGVFGRLFGMLAAPAFFTALYDNKRIVFVSAAAIGLVASVGVGKLLSMAPVGQETDEQFTKSDKPPDRADFFLFAFAVSIYVSLYLFGANMIYLLRDRLMIPYPETRGGTAIVVMFGSALLSNGLAAVVQRKLPERTTRRIRLLPLAVSAVVLFGIGGVLALGWRPAYLTFLAGACLLGVSYGVFLWEVRDYSSYAARNDGKSILVSWFNNVGNVSSLIAFATMLVFAATRGSVPGSFYVRILSAIAGVPIVGLMFLAAASRLVRIGPRH